MIGLSWASLLTPILRAMKNLTYVEGLKILFFLCPLVPLTELYNHFQRSREFQMWLHISLGMVTAIKTVNIKCLSRRFVAGTKVKIPMFILSAL